MEGALEVVVVVARAHGQIELGQARQHIALKLGHVRVRHREAWAVMREIAEQEAERVPELAVRLDIGLDDVGTDTQILGIVRAHGP